MSSIFMGSASMHWLLASMERLIVAEELKELMKSSRKGFKVFLVRRCANNYGHYVVILKYDGGGVWWGFVVVLEEGKDWSGFVGELKSIDIFQTSFGDGQIAPSPLSKERLLMPAVMVERAPLLLLVRGLSLRFWLDKGIVHLVVQSSKRARLGQKKLYLQYDWKTAEESATMHMKPVFAWREGTW
ncbi:hypothetical protein SLA2020_336030 [Shorea laevis]